MGENIKIIIVETDVLIVSTLCLIQQLYNIKDSQLFKLLGSSEPKFQEIRFPFLNRRA